jgi:hypothetical protein
VAIGLTDPLATITELDDIGSLHRKVAIETLSDNVLLEIFDLYLEKVEEIDPWYAGFDWNPRRPYDAWYALVHVCQRWRYIVFASPRRLNLRLLCPRTRRIRKMLGVWPALPIVIWDTVDFMDEDNIIAALEQHDHVCEIKLERFTRSQQEKLVPLMRKSFPALTKLHIDSRFRKHCGLAPDLPDSFLGGSAPRLQFLCLESVTFPALPNLLLSSGDLVYLYLSGFPSGYITPEMATGLSALTRLENMRLFFDYPISNSHPEDRPPAPLMRSLLPALKELELRGDGEYLDDFVARIDAPSINCLRMKLTGLRFSVVNLLHLPQFIGRVEKFQSFGYADIYLDYRAMDIAISPQAWTPDSKALLLTVSYHLTGALPSLVEGCKSSLFPMSNIEHLNISAQPPYWEFNPLWLELLRQFPAAKSLSLGSEQIVPPVAFALKQVIEEGMTDVLPAIRKLSVSGPLPAGPDREAIERFVTARGLPAFE